MPQRRWALTTAHALLSTHRRNSPFYTGPSLEQGRIIPRRHQEGTHMQANIDETNERFRRRFRQANIAWFIITLLTLGLTSWGLFSSRPHYLHDWHSVA